MLVMRTFMYMRIFVDCMYGEIMIKHGEVYAVFKQQALTKTYIIERTIKLPVYMYTLLVHFLHLTVWTSG